MEEYYLIKTFFLLGSIFGYTIEYLATLWLMTNYGIMQKDSLFLKKRTLWLEGAFKRTVLKKLNQIIILKMIFKYQLNNTKVLLKNDVNRLHKLNPVNNLSEFFLKEKTLNNSIRVISMLFTIKLMRFALKDGKNCFLNFSKIQLC